MVAIKAGRKLIDRIEQLIKQTDADRAGFLKYYKLTSISEITTAQASDAIFRLERKLRGKKA